MEMKIPEIEYQLYKNINYKATDDNYGNIILALIAITKEYSDYLEPEEIVNAINYIKTIYEKRNI
jgi:hypothetical protein